MILATALAFTQSPPKVSQPPTEGPAVGESPAWFLQGSFPDPTGRTIVDKKGNVTVPPRSGGPGRGRGAGGNTTGAESASPVVQVPPCEQVARVRTAWGNSAPVAAARAVETNDGIHVYPSIRTASRLWRRAVGRSRFKGQPLGLSARRRRQAAALQVRSELQAHPPGRPRCDRLPDEGPRYGCGRRRQRLDHCGGQRHRQEDQSRRQTALDHRPDWTQRRLG